MSFKKMCKRVKKGQSGQAALEYFILFAIVAALTLLSISPFFASLQQSGETAFQEAVKVIGDDDGS